ncbi:uncharacterized protein BX663DRAFT_500269 [Cokeromyces recurvatus]|uniref:uncharacterized protein n=1 Tax=Cokeromyces recurvatus TaxID=90255 RepID=UPI00221E5975|nr:uncharacterized protein BX663DRAFT_500269 [Cokeromyces recurvatus]KAI7905592.1 hypothetical protein BX663DRAFT_500269 [Cokeromyces recurvatus]
MNKDNKLMMTPVPEVDEEEQLVDKDEQQETDVLAVVEVEEEEEENDENKTPSYVLLPTPENKLCSLSEASLSAPSLTSGRTSPSSSSSHHSFSHDEELYYDQQEDKYDTINNISSFYLADTTPLPTQTKEEEKEKEKEKEEEDVDETDQRYDVQQSSEINRNSLISDVQKLSELNKALMTPQVPHPHLPTIIQQQQQQQQYLTPITSYQPSITSYQMNEYANVNRSSFESITSFSLTNNKDSIKTYRRMASKTMDYNVQYSYAKYLMRLVSFYASNSNNVATIETRIRLQEEAEYWIERLAKMNYAPALYTKGQWHRHCCSSKTAAVFVGSQYKKVSHTKAFKCFQQAAKYGSIEAHYELAEYYMVRKDYKKSITCYQYAASKNHILSLYKLANISMRGLLDQPKNIKQGLIYLRHAADANQPECARSAYDYACILLSDLESIGLDRDPSVFSIYITPDSVAAIYYLKKADKFGLSNATYRLGCMSLAEQSIHSKWEAFKYFSRAAEQKHDGAMIELSKLYKEGISGYLNPHPMLAYEWCLRVAEKGNEMAEYMIGMYYDKGIGIYPDHQKAREWYSKSAAKGYRPAEEILGIQSSSSNNKSTKNQRHYYEESIRLEENSRQVTFAEQNCQIM